MADFQGLKTSDLLRSLERLEEQVAKAPPEKRDAEDLRLHKAELELQNRQLRESQEALESSRDRYSSLYDLSPVGYFTLDGKGKILECNLTAAALIGRLRSHCAGTFLDSYLEGKVEMQRFARHLREAKAQPTGYSSELRIALPEGGSLPVTLETLYVDHAPEGLSFRCAMSDISERRKREELLQIERADRARLEDQNRRLLHETLEARDRHDLAMAKNIHDELGQPTAALVVRALLIAKTSKDTDVVQAAEQMVTICNAMAEQVRGLCHTLRPPIMNGLAPLDTLRQLVNNWDVARSQTEVELSIEEGIPEWSDELTLTVYRILQEALSNVRHHSHATNVNVTLRPLTGESGEWVEVVVGDDGVGIGDGAMDHGLGLIAMRERIAVRGGQLLLTSKEGQGVTLVARLPVVPGSGAPATKAEAETPTV